MYPAVTACSLHPLHCRRSIFGATGEYGPWAKIAEAVPLDELGAAGPDLACTGAWAGEAGCSLVEAADATSISLWPCRRVRYLRLDLEEPNDCCYQILEWETLGLGSGAFCSVPCMNGGTCAVAYSGAEPQCDCPIPYGWKGPLTGCTVRNVPARLHRLVRNSVQIRARGIMCVPRTPCEIVSQCLLCDVRCGVSSARRCVA
eukprot:COSAG02_NODE_7193_length_3126_cov_10.474397_2_plen_202_part_00